MLLRAARKANVARVAVAPSSRLFSKIVYTKCDEAPALATYALLPIIQRFCKPANIEVTLSDISVAARIIAHFPERLTAEQRQPDELAELGELAKTPEGIIIKLPNVSASIPQLNEAIAELQGKGYNLPNYPQNPTNEEEQKIHDTYAKVLGSAVNPVLREGNSDRRVAAPVKEYAQKNPHKLMAWPKESKTCVTSMTDGDFYSSEKSATMSAADDVKIEFISKSGETETLKASTPLLAGEVIDGSAMNVKQLRNFFEKSLNDAKAQNLMVSLHLKCTMMKISDPIMFGHCVSVFFKDAFAKHAATFAELKINPNNGLGDVYEKIEGHPKQKEIEQDLAAAYTSRPGLAMVDSSQGITNLHVPSDVIIDASMPVVMRDAGMMWNKDDALEDVMCMIPDRNYAGIYDEMTRDIQKNGQFDVTTMGNVANVGLMAQKAEEYGSHDKTFQAPSDGTIRVTNKAGQTVFENSVEEGDIWRMCQTKDEPIKDWVKLAVERARLSGSAAIFWLDENRAHDAQLIAKVNSYLKDHDTNGLDISILPPQQAMAATIKRCRAGQDTISVTGNVLRDYLTDLFPILELGTSAKMLSIVPLLAGGAMFETGAGGSAPKHVQQFEKEGHLRWDSLGEYLAMACALEMLGQKTNNQRALLLGQTLTEATGMLLNEVKSPSRKVNEIDNRGSSFYIALYWAKAMAAHDDAFAPLAAELAANEAKITQDLIDCQGPAQDVGGYYQPNDALADKAMRPSATLNKLIDL